MNEIELLTIFFKEWRYHYEITHIKNPLNLFAMVKYNKITNPSHYTLYVSAEGRIVWGKLPYGYKKFKKDFIKSVENLEKKL